MQGMGGLFDLTIVAAVLLVWWLIELRVKRLDKKPPESEPVAKDDDRVS